MQKISRCSRWLGLARLYFRGYSAAQIGARLLSSAASVRASDGAPVLNPEIRLRDYQEECIQSVLSHLDAGHKRLGVSLATGSGKTVIFTQLIGRVNPPDHKRSQSLILVHRKELVEQAAEHCTRAYPDKTIEIEMANSHATGTADITIASIRSLLSKGRIEKYNPERFKLVLVDEAHHIVAPSYREALAHFNLGEANADSPALVGVSATFSRFDGLKLGAAIDYIVYHKDYVDMIGENWLSDALFTTVKSHVDLSRVGDGPNGDFQTHQLSLAVNTETANDITVSSWRSKAGERKSTLVFCVDIAHVRDLTAKFREIGVDARYITGQTPKDVRAKELEAFRNYEFPVLVNCGLFTEGTDIPNIDCLDKLSAKDAKEKRENLDKDPTQGQGAKKGCYPEEEDVVVGFTDYDSVHDLVQDASGEDHIRAISENAWVQVSPHRYILSAPAGRLTISKDNSGLFSVHHVISLSPSGNSKSPFSRPREVVSAVDLVQAIHAADTLASRVFGGPVYIASWQPWRKRRASPGQIGYLRKQLGKEIPDKITKGEAADMITKLKHGAKGQFKELLSSKRRSKRELEKVAKWKEMAAGEEVKIGPLA
ncbi:DEAD/DEAH box helicase [Trichophyton equinum CBS 127.97]|uniref:DEAD/DEAH box helicase n=1 Tax=Trichophyton equinum (strain ATCC MYA-4606 / CBS 127.97) TaxID=559882 RepID=F2Q548_TRIEC|nr:DEAD/DEAH box helicase [Trichophyton equinum CBS 127.97]